MNAYTISKKIPLQRKRQENNSLNQVNLKSEKEEYIKTLDSG